MVYYYLNHDVHASAVILVLIHCILLLPFLLCGVVWFLEL